VCCCFSPPSRPRTGADRRFPQQRFTGGKRGGSSFFPLNHPSEPFFSCLRSFALLIADKVSSSCARNSPFSFFAPPISNMEDLLPAFRRLPPVVLPYQRLGRASTFLHQSAGGNFFPLRKFRFSEMKQDPAPPFSFPETPAFLV